MKKGLSNEFIVCSSTVAGGMLAGILQIAVLREYFAGFEGNEFVIGILMAAWMLLNAIGTRMNLIRNKTVTMKTLAVIQILLCVFAVLTWVASVFFSIWFSARAFAVPGWVLYSVFGSLLLLPFCIVNGMQFNCAVGLLQKVGEHLPSKNAGLIYLSDSLGMVAGFGCATFLYMLQKDMLKILILSVLIGLITAAVLYWGMQLKPIYPTLVGVFLLILVMIFTGNWSGSIKKVVIERSLNGEKLIETLDSLYSHIMVTSIAGQKNFYVNGRIEGVYPDSDPSVEKNVHLSLLSHPNPETILVVGGILKGAVSEVYKHHPKEIIYCDIDPMIITTAFKYMDNLTIPKKSIKFYTGDTRRLIRESIGKFDMILLSVPPPSTLMLNRYYTSQFFMETKKALKKNGILSVTLASSENYGGENQKRRNNSILRAVESAYPEEFFINGDDNLLLAAGQIGAFDILSELMPDRLKQRKIKTEMITSEYISYEMQPRRLKEAAENFIIQSDIKTNNDLKPAAVLYQMALLNEAQYPGFNKIFEILIKVQWWQILIGIGSLFLFLIGYLKVRIPEGRRRENNLRLLMLFSGFIGFAGMNSLLYLYQSREGSLYSEIGMLSSSILIGYTLGSWLCGKWKQIGFIRILKCFSGILFFLIVISVILNNIPGSYGGFFIKGLALVWGILNGMIYPALSGFLPRKDSDIVQSAVSYYGYELVGAAVGAVTGMIFLPVFGFSGAMFLLQAVTILIILLLFNLQRNILCLDIMKCKR